MRPLRIVYVSHHSKEPLGGAARTSLMLARAMQRRGHEVHTFFADDLLPKVDSSRSMRLLFAKRLRRLTKFLTQLSPDVVDVTGGYGRNLFNALAEKPILKVARSYGLEESDWAETVMDSTFGRIEVSRRARLFYGWWEPFAVRKSVRAADLFIAPTNSSLRIMSTSLPHLGGVAIGLGVEKELLGMDPISGLDPLRILFVGGSIARKGFQDFAVATSRIMLEDPSACVVILGSGSTQQAVHSSFPPSVRERVEIHPWLSRQAQLEVMVRSSVCVSTSVSEGFGLATLEALALGLPVIATRTGFLAESETAELAILIPKRSPTALEEALHRLRTSLANLADLRLKGKVWAASQTWEKVAQRTEEAYAGALSARKDRCENF